jgi:hypothetical protein
VKALLVLLVGVFFVARLSRTFGPTERRIAAGSVLLHGAAAIAEEAIFRLVYGAGDMFAYQSYGALLARYISMDVGEHALDVIGLFFQNADLIPFHVPGAGSATGSMCALAGLMTYVFSNSLYAMGAAIGVGSAVGLVLIYRCVRAEVPIHLQTRACVALLLLPSVVFWTSAILKEAVIMLPCALVFFGMHRLGESRSKRIQGLVLIAVGGGIVALFKPYILAGFFAGAPVYFYAKRAIRQGKTLRFSWARLATILVIAPLFLILYGRLFSDFDVNDLGERLAQQQLASLRASGTSSYSIVSPDSTSLVSQLANAPIAVFTALYRPIVFEAHNAQALVNAAESTALLCLTVLAFARHGVRTLVRFVTIRPMLLTFVVYSAVLALGVGLATTNLGALSRYRVPMYGQFALLLAVISARRLEPLQSQPLRTLSEVPRTTS